jgi:branched-chain amino acid transport system permease protein
MKLKLVLDQLLNGLVLGSMYALFASGLTLIWGTMKMLNFAHGEYYMLGGYSIYFVLTLLGLHPVVGVLISLGTVFLSGLLTERFLIHPLLEKPGWEISTIVATLGISIFLQNLALKAWGERYKSIPYFIEGTLNVHGFRISYQRLMILVVAIVVIGAFLVFIKKTRFGMALRATAQDREASVLIGIDFHRIYLITFGISSAMAALAATMLSPIFLINPWMGVPYLLKAFVVCVLGGLGSFGGAILAGIILGMVESFVVIVISSEWKDVFSFGILVLSLTIRPSGFFGYKEQ